MENTMKSISQAAIEADFDMLEYLKIKYNQSFLVVGRMEKSWGVSSDQWSVKPIGGNSGEIFNVIGCDDSQNRFRDSYYSVLILPEYERFVNAVVGKRFSNYKLLVELDKQSYCPESLVKGVSLADIHKHTGGGSLRSQISIFISEPDKHAEDIDIAIKSICDEIAHAKLCTWLQCINMPRDIFSAIEGEGLENCTSQPITYVVDDNYEVVRQGGLVSRDFAVSSAELSTWQLERLCCLVYLDDILMHKNKGSVGDILRYMRNFGYADSGLPCFMTQQEWDAVIDSCLSDIQICGLRIVKSVDIISDSSNESEVLPGHRAVCFMDAQDRAYVIFRGTYGDEEWLDNARGMLETDTIQQKAAAQFVSEVHESKSLNVQKLTVSGHSKGANKAQYVTLTTQDGYVDRCVSFDGQGFSFEFLNRYKNNIADRKEKIELLAEQRDFVNCLGNYITKTSFYRGKRGDAREAFPYGEPLPFFHCPDALRISSGEIGEKYSFGYISTVINSIIIFFLSNEKYKKIRKRTAEDIVALMMSDRRASIDAIAEAIKNLSIVFFDITANNEQFDNSITDIVCKESDVLIATVETVFGVGNSLAHVEKQQTLGSMVLSKLASDFISNREHLRFLGVVLKKLVGLIKKLLRDIRANSEIAQYINCFVCDLLMHISNMTTSRTAKVFIRQFLVLWQRLVNVKMDIASMGFAVDTTVDEDISDEITNDLIVMLEDWDEKLAIS